MVLRKECRKKLPGENGELVVYDLLAETASDLTGLPRAAVGSLAYVLADGKLYVKKADASWAEVTSGAGAAETAPAVGSEEET